MDIRRIDGYKDDRFTRSVLYQHGAYLIGSEPYEVEITGPGRAIVRGRDPARYKALIDEFRIHAPHIFEFFDMRHERIAAFPSPELFDIDIDRVQPSQFFVDEEKLEAIGTFIHRPEDIVIQVIAYGARFISLDGHTRLLFAARKGFKTVKAVMSETDDWVWPFVREAEKRNITRPEDMILLPHDEYEIKWNRYCDSVFAREDMPRSEEAQ